MFFKLIKKNNGVGLLEILMSSVITLVVFSALVYALTNTEKQLSDISQTSSAYKSAAYISQSLLSHSKTYQFYPVGTEGFAGVTKNFEITSAQKKVVYDLLAFSLNKEGEVQQVEDCPGCQFRVGISIAPLASSQLGTRGLFKVWILGIEKIADTNDTNDSNDSNSYKVFLDIKMLAPLI